MCNHRNDRKMDFLDKDSKTEVSEGHGDLRDEKVLRSVGEARKIISGSLDKR